MRLPTMPNHKVSEKSFHKQPYRGNNTIFYEHILTRYSYHIVRYKFYHSKSSASYFRIMSQNKSLNFSFHLPCLHNLYGIIIFYLVPRFPCRIEHRTQKEELAAQYHRVAEDISGGKFKSRGSNNTT
jgi:hypothetical protein